MQTAFVFWSNIAILSKQNRSSLMRKWTALPSLVLIAACLCPLTAVAQDSAELLARMKAMEDRIKSLEAEVQTLKGQQAVTPSPAVAQAAPEAVARQAPVNLGGAGGGA